MPGVTGRLIFGRKAKAKMMTTGEAVRYLRESPQHTRLIRDAYLGEDVQEAAERFLASAEFADARALLGDGFQGGKVLDLGAGVGIASYAFAQSGAQIVYALEPDASEVVGRGAISRLQNAAAHIELLEAFGEEIPLPDNELDVVYTRQVLHHTRDTGQVLRECARVLKSGGKFLACREHVVESEDELKTFLEQHPIHRLAGGEHAFPLDAYVSAITSAGLRVEKILGPWDSLINAFPEVRTNDELERLPQKILAGKFGHAVGAMAVSLPGVKNFIWKRVKSQTPPGRMYSFLASKP